VQVVARDLPVDDTQPRRRPAALVQVSEDDLRQSRRDKIERREREEKEKRERRRS
jgi:hypothetical protein